MKYLYRLFCFFGIHRKHTFTREREVNWIPMSIKITECKNCKKFYKID